VNSRQRKCGKGNDMVWRRCKASVKRVPHMICDFRPGGVWHMIGATKKHRHLSIIPTVRHHKRTGDKKESGKKSECRIKSTGEALGEPFSVRTRIHYCILNYLFIQFVGHASQGVDGDELIIWKPFGTLTNLWFLSRSFSGLTR
jgi:hypothetical protein